jgi:hypothetical protein
MALIDSCSSVKEIVGNIVTQNLHMPSPDNFGLFVMERGSGALVLLPSSTILVDIIAAEKPQMFNFGVSIWNFDLEESMNKFLLHFLYTTIRTQVLEGDIPCSVQEAIELATEMFYASALDPPHK